MINDAKIIDAYRKESMKTIKEGVKEIKNIEFLKTKEFARLNRVNLLSITNLRIKGMWPIDNPANLLNAKLITWGLA